MQLQSGPGPARKRLLGTDGLQGSPEKLQKSCRNTFRIQDMISATFLQLHSATKWARTGPEEAPWHRWPPRVTQKVAEKLQKHIQNPGHHFCNFPATLFSYKVGPERPGKGSLAQMPPGVTHKVAEKLQKYIQNPGHDFCNFPATLFSYKEGPDRPGRGSLAQMARKGHPKS